MEHLVSQLAELERHGLRRQVTTWADSGGKIRLPDGRTLLNFSSNDYLDLSHHPSVKAAAISAIERFGCSSSASRLMCGSLELHDQLEKALARFVGTEAALVFPSGFGMNVGLVPAIASRDDVIFADRLNHASLVDGARLSGAKLRRFDHNDLAMLQRQLAAETAARHRLILCEAIYSMDGDAAPLDEMAELARQYGASLVVDAAHAIGVSRPADGGQQLLIGTLGKALASQGGFVGCSQAMRDYLINRARSFIFSTALAPASVAAALAAVEWIEAHPQIGQELLDRAAAFHGLLAKEGLRLSPFTSQIIPVHVGENEPAVKLAETLRGQGLLVTAVRPPTVPAGTARLRLSVTLAHNLDDLVHAAGLIGSAARSAGLA